MNIPINKDIEQTYKNEFIKGFTMAEAGCIALAFSIIAGVAVLLYFVTSLSPDVCVYAGIPVGFPVLFVGFKKFWGMPALKYATEIIWEHQTGTLDYFADEAHTEPEPFDLRKTIRKGKKR